MEDFKCSVCGETFQTKDELIYHIKEDHSTVEITGFKCSICGGVFQSAGALTQHLKDDHPSDVP